MLLPLSRMRTGSAAPSEASLRHSGMDSVLVKAPASRRMTSWPVGRSDSFAFFSSVQGQSGGGAGGVGVGMGGIEGVGVTGGGVGVTSGVGSGQEATTFSLKSKLSFSALGAG